jgi:hypothetical protein
MSSSEGLFSIADLRWAIVARELSFFGKLMAFCKEKKHNVYRFAIAFSVCARSYRDNKSFAANGPGSSGQDKTFTEKKSSGYLTKSYR